MAKFLDLATLDKHMLTASYIEGASPTQKDVAVFKALCPAPGPGQPHAARWYAHIKAMSDAKMASLLPEPALGTAQGVGKPIAVSLAPATEGAAAHASASLLSYAQQRVRAGQIGKRGA